MHKKAFVLGLLSLFVSLILIVGITETTVSHPNLQALAAVTGILFVIGIIVTVYSIWHDVSHV